MDSLNTLFGFVAPLAKNTWSLNWGIVNHDAFVHFAAGVLLWLDYVTLSLSLVLQGAWRASLNIRNLSMPAPQMISASENQSQIGLDLQSNVVYFL